jgi:hypothetical protein
MRLGIVQLGDPRAHLATTRDRWMKPPWIAPAHVPSAFPQARSSSMIVWVVPLMMPAMRTKLLRKKRPRPLPRLSKPNAVWAGSSPVDAAYQLGTTVATVLPNP